MFFHFFYFIKSVYNRYFAHFFRNFNNWAICPVGQIILSEDPLFEGGRDARTNEHRLSELVVLKKGYFCLLPRTPKCRGMTYPQKRVCILAKSKALKSGSSQAKLEAGLNNLDCIEYAII